VGHEPPYTIAPAPGPEVIVPVVTLYTVAFLKTFLEGDHRYMRFLAPGYAEVHGLRAVVEIEP
jgi:hypothetical protein